MRRMIGYELKKIFMSRTALAAIGAVLVLNVLYGVSACRSLYAYDGTREGSGLEAVEIDKALTERYAGPLTDETVRRILEDFPLTVDLHGMNPKYYYINAVQSAAYAYFVGPDGRWNGQTVADVFGGEAAAVEVGYVNGWLTVSGLLQRTSVLLSVLVVVLTAPVFAREYGGMDSLILTARYGRSQCGTAKCAAGLISAAGLAVVFGLGNFLAALAVYGREGLACDIRFAPAEFVGLLPYPITCGALIARQTVLAFTAAVGAAGISLLASALCRGQMAALAAGLGVHFLPAALPVSETSPLYHLAVLAPVIESQGLPVLTVGARHWVWAALAAAGLAAGGSLLAARVFRERSV